MGSSVGSFPTLLPDPNITLALTGLVNGMLLPWLASAAHPFPALQLPPGVVEDPTGLTLTLT